MASTEPAAAPAPKDPSSPSPHHAPPPPPPPPSSSTAPPPPPNTSGTHPNPNNPNGGGSNPNSHPSVVSGHTHQQLASLLEAAFGENAALRDKLAVTGRRLEHAERVANRLTSAFSDVPNGTSSSSPSNNPSNSSNNNNGAAVLVNAEHLRRIAELEMQVVALEEARGDAEGRARAVVERWAHVEGHLHELGVGAQRAQRDFALFLRESLPLGAAHAHQGYAPYPVNLGLPPNTVTSLRRGRTPSMDTMHPPSKRSRGNDGGHRYTHSNSYPPQIETLPPPSNPPYRARLIQHPPHHRPRSSSHSSVESVDEFMSKTVQADESSSNSHPSNNPPSNNTHGNGIGGMGGGSLQILHAQGSVHGVSGGRRGRKGEVRLTDAEALAQAQAQQAAAISAAQSHSQSHHPSSSSNSFTQTQSLTQTQSQNYLPGGGVYSARRIVDGGNAYPASQSVPGRKEGGGGGGGYTTHIFAPVQTGAPMKKGKYGGSFGACAFGRHAWTGFRLARRLMRFVLSWCSFDL
ncbi:hypothetical protein D9611_012193 [Ephemerocybe angulata]|uniref:Uncharacterized protein n=1 Tax=Ephemerocybe angulata TaxID=980116 RepID=A0A8H5C5G3_9AGAR|nr:hypothetical protein D9611_012193 [Tulosesus angulatus]